MSLRGRIFSQNFNSETLMNAVLVILVHVLLAMKFVVN
jgi:hypothetical protein